MGLVSLFLAMFIVVATVIGMVTCDFIFGSWVRSEVSVGLTPGG